MMSFTPEASTLVAKEEGAELSYFASSVNSIICNIVVPPWCTSYYTTLLYFIPQVPLPELAGLRRLPSLSPSEPSELPSSCTAASSGASGCCRCHTHAVGLGHPIGFHTSPPSPCGDVVFSSKLGAASSAYSSAATAVPTISRTAAAACSLPCSDELPTRKPLLLPGMRYPLQGVRGDHLDIEVTFRWVGGGSGHRGDIIQVRAGSGGVGLGEWDPVPECSRHEE